MSYFFIPLLFWVLPLFAESAIPGILADPLATENNASTTATINLPSPEQLTADWWRYLEAKPSELKQRSNTMIQQAQTIVHTQGLDANLDIKQYLDVFTENMRTLQELRKKIKTPTPPPVALQKNYTLQEWLEIVHKRRTLQAELQSENQDLQRNVKRLDALRQRFDALTAAYLALPNQTQDKTLQGLALMAAWSAQTVHNERLLLQNNALAMQQAQVNQLREANTAAQNHLIAHEDDIPQLEQEIEAAERELNTARETASQLASSFLSNNLAITDDAKARSLLVEQKIKHSNVAEAIAEAQLTRKKIELELAHLLNAPDDSALGHYREQLHDNLDNIRAINVNLDIWRDEAEQDQGRAGKSLAALFGTASRQTKTLINLTQQRLTEAQNTLLSLQRLDSEIHDAHLFADQLERLIANKDGGFKSGLETIKTTFVKAWEWLAERMGISLFKVGETPVTTFGILRIILIVLLAWSFSHFVRRGLTHISERQYGNAAFLYTFARLAHYMILIIGISIGLSSVGVDLSNFALIAGALSLGIGFGLQAIVSNFVSGLIVLFERSLRIGDFVELSSGLAGEVRAINVRSTLVTTTDMVEILVPNSEFVNNKVINWTLTDASRRIHIPFGVAYGSDKELVRKAGLEAAMKTPHTIKNRTGREPEVWLINFGDSSLDFELIVWIQPQAVKKPQRVRAAYYWELETALHKYGIEIPFPQRDLHIRSGLKEPASLIEETLPLNTTKSD